MLDAPPIVLCPGQGAQRVGMGKAWLDASPAAKAVFAEADDVLSDSLGKPLSELCFTGPDDRLNRTDVSQPAIYTTSVACYRALIERGDLTPDIAGTAGLSLGEYTALHLAGVFTFAQGLKLVSFRGALMQAAAEQSEGSMVALVGADDAQAETICQTALRHADASPDDVLVCANFNSPGQIVLSGSKIACERAMTAATDLGVRSTALTVAGAFHSALMQPAADGMAEALADADFQAPATPVWSNVTAEPHPPSDLELLKRRLVQQIVSPVRWSQTCQTLVSSGLLDYHELAPGTVLKGLMRRIDRNAKVTSHDEP